ncbi:class V lanthionine synthetase subunit LxmK [Streptomyces sp. NPDC006739]|uniref:class V lanthionine synthetase subunit LxmK n=1 Tax=Streptomyces sp. NPDC006739 TaxID=3364763 RepID=UPI003698F442
MMAKVGYAPSDLDSVPEVDSLLERLGLGAFDRGTLASAPGRNDAWTGTTTGGHKVFAKRLRGPEDDVRGRLARLLAFESFAGGGRLGALNHPVMLGSDLAAGLVVFECVDGARNGAELMVDQTFDDALAFSAGQAIGSVHATDPGAAELETEPPSLPAPHLLRGIPESIFGNMSFGQISAWTLMQNDPELIEGVESLLDAERRAEKVPAHCDLRVDQFLVRNDVLYIADWEEFRLADAARDVGGFAGEWLYRSILDIVTTRGEAEGGSAFVDFELTHDLIVSRGVEKLERLRPRIEHFWRGYRSVRPQAGAGLRERATAFAGWHALDRLMASASRTSRLSGIERAAAGVGRAALLAPARFATTLGLEETV